MPQHKIKNLIYKVSSNNCKKCYFGIANCDTDDQDKINKILADISLKHKTALYYYRRSNSKKCSDLSVLVFKHSACKLSCVELVRGNKGDKRFQYYIDNFDCVNKPCYIIYKISSPNSEKCFIGSLQCYVDNDSMLDILLQEKINDHINAFQTYKTSKKLIDLATWVIEKGNYTVDILDVIKDGSHTAKLSHYIINNNCFNNFKGVVYKITSPHTKKCYIGSVSCEPYDSSYQDKLNTRFIQHKSCYNHFSKNPSVKYPCTSIELFQFGDCTLHILEFVYDFTLLQREQFYIDRNNSVNTKSNFPRHYLYYKITSDYSDKFFIGLTWKSIAEIRKSIINNSFDHSLINTPDFKQIIQDPEFIIIGLFDTVNDVVDDQLIRSVIDHPDCITSIIIK